MYHEPPSQKVTRRVGDEKGWVEMLSERLSGTYAKGTGWMALSWYLCMRVLDPFGCSLASWMMGHSEGFFRVSE